MGYKGEGVEALVAVLDDLQRSSLILADNKIKSLLSCLAYYPEFREVLKECNINFNYEAERQRILVEVNGRHVIHLPQSKKTLVAFVLQMLVDFDNQKLDLIKFASTYFPADTNQQSFMLFCENVLGAFKVSLVDMVVNGIEEEQEDVERVIELASSNVLDETEYLLVDIAEEIKGANITDEERSDLMLMLEGFATALDNRDVLMIKATWLGIKRALNFDKLCKNSVEKMDEALKMFLVVK